MMLITRYADANADVDNASAARANDNDYNSPP